MSAGVSRSFCYGLVCVIQLAVPGSLLVRRQLALHRGEVYRFQARPVDPVDPFRGRYVALAFEQSRVPVDHPEDFHEGQTAYALLGTDPAGWALITGVQRHRPAHGPYLRVRVRRSDPAGRTVHLALPFDRYYLNEKLAPEAERVARLAGAAGQHQIAAEVRVHRGLAVLEDLLVDGIPIHAFLEAAKANPSPTAKPPQPTP